MFMIEPLGALNWAAVAPYSEQSDPITLDLQRERQVNSFLPRLTIRFVSKSLQSEGVRSRAVSRHRRLRLKVEPGNDGHQSGM